MLTFTHKRIIIRECKRIQTVLKRDDLEHTKEFVKQGIVQYGESLKTGYGKAYSDELRASIVAYILFLKYCESKCLKI